MQAMAYLSRRRAARLACERAAPCALIWHPAPPTAGDPVRARLLARGVLLFDGRLVETDAALPWDLAPPDAVWSDHLHGHGWLDHAAAADDPRLWAHFEGWIWAWIERHGDGSGPGWRADLVPPDAVDRPRHPPAARTVARAEPRLLRGAVVARPVSRLALARDRGRRADRGAGRPRRRWRSRAGRPGDPRARRPTGWSGPMAASPAATRRSWRGSSPS